MTRSAVEKAKRGRVSDYRQNKGSEELISPISVYRSGC